MRSLDPSESGCALALGKAWQLLRKMIALRPVACFTREVAPRGIKAMSLAV